MIDFLEIPTGTSMQSDTLDFALESRPLLLLQSHGKYDFVESRALVQAYDG
jgi:hypothetical protein